MQATKTPSKVTVAVILLITSFLEPGAATSDDNSFVYAGCSPQKYLLGSEYEANVNSLLASILTSSSSLTRSPFTNLTSGTVHGLFQCRLDLNTIDDCHACVSTNLYQLSVLCPASVSAVLRLQGCYVRYGDADFLGVEDKTVVVNTCGPQQLQIDSDELTRRNSMLGYLVSDQGEQPFKRAGGDGGGVQGVAECVGDLSPDQCRDCLGQAVCLLQTDCLYASSGDVYLASCYARYYTASHAPSRLAGATNDGDWQKTLAIIIGIIAAVGFIVCFAACLRKHCKDDECDHK